LHTDPTIRLLLLSGTGHVGQGVLAALERRRAEVEVVSTGIVAAELAQFDFDAVYRVPVTAADPGGFATSLLDIVARERPALIVPCRDDDVLALAELRIAHPRLPALCGELQVARIMTDKWLSAQFATAQGLPFAPTFARESGTSPAAFAAEHGYPLIAKPRRSAGSGGVRLVTNAAQRDAALARGDCVLQRYLGDPAAADRFLDDVTAAGLPLFYSFEGRMRSLQALIAPDGEVVQVVCTSTVMRQGHSERVQLDADPGAHALGARCARTFAAAGWRGPLNVQCQETPEGELAIHEFNGRFTGATAARSLLGRDEVGPAIEAFTGHRWSNRTAAAAFATQVVRVPFAQAPDAERLRAIERDGYWRRRGTTTVH
jgi:hypothetical protein